jgi:hypothetical protein
MDFCSQKQVLRKTSAAMQYYIRAGRGKLHNENTKQKKTSLALIHEQTILTE